MAACKQSQGSSASPQLGNSVFYMRRMNLSVDVFTPGLRAEPVAEAGGCNNMPLRAVAPLQPGRYEMGCTDTV